jgi:hypothetical protein
MNAKKVKRLRHALEYEDLLSDSLQRPMIEQPFHILTNSDELAKAAKLGGKFVPHVEIKVMAVPRPATHAEKSMRHAYQTIKRLAGAK